MPFELTRDQRTLREETRRFTREEIAPVADELDANREYPGEILDALAERGVTGLTVAETYGGRGAGPVELAVVVEELSAGLMSVAAALSLHLGVAEVVERFGTDAQRERFLPAMAAFERVGALGLAEAGAGSDKAAMETRAERDGDEWVLSGHKQWVTNVADADVVLLYARTDPPEERGGISAFLVPAGALDVVREWDVIGGRSVGTYRVEFDGVRVGTDRLVGERGRALERRGALRTGVNLPARAVGVARAALSDAVDYVHEREQFGRAVEEYQGVRWRVAEMSQRVEAARLLTLRAASAAARDAPTASGDTSLAKVYATEAAVDTASDAMGLHGGVGYTGEHSVERYFRDAKLLTIAGGSNDVHRNAVADAAFSR
ncbi:acyl-CoA dehydrogenase family protein [Halomarina ordinaria]|uniref:Acyl-CoA dehydrogenase family protein n=1 Tax=Halomarina ordinaria TaxID=3033939 RepID=A0ABD5U8F1_9EURY|nr:acyl-CoA dehydrogenase family protein [Halomarina sp. PSRA2]